LAEFEIRRLAPSELEPFLEFMDGPAFKAQPQWQGCYCQFYLNTAAENAEPKAKQALNRVRACDRINAGTMQGYVAKVGERVIGWMAANRASNFVLLPPAPENVARILCFVVDQDYQGRGVATELLRFAIGDLPNHGYEMVEAAPLAGDAFVPHGYRGPRSLFEKAGFEAGEMLDEQHIRVYRKLTD
jgi:GNAT superfamily N-acetyltransferase